MKKFFGYSLIITIWSILMIVIVTTLLVHFSPLKFEESLKISISFTALFATFGGAYIGAKISGDRARETQKEQLRIRNLESKIDNNIKYINIFNHLNNNINKKIVFKEFPRRFWMMERILFFFNYLTDKKLRNNNFNRIFKDLDYITSKTTEFDRIKNKNNLFGTNLSSLVIKETDKVINVFLETSEFQKKLYKFIFLNIQKQLNTNLKEIDFNKMGVKISDGKIIAVIGIDKDKKYYHIDNLKISIWKKIQYSYIYTKQIYKLRNAYESLAYKSSKEFINYINKLYIDY